MTVTFVLYFQVHNRMCDEMRIKVISKFYFDQPVFTKCGLESNQITFSMADRVSEQESVPANVSHHECDWAYDLTPQADKDH